MASSRQGVNYLNTIVLKLWYLKKSIKLLPVLMGGGGRNYTHRLSGRKFVHAVYRNKKSYSSRLSGEKRYCCCLSGGENVTAVFSMS